MSAGFSLYGALLIVAAVQTMRHARRRSDRHQEWALRLIVLALGSWLYRVHYGLWDLFTDGLYSSTADFSGAFDQVQNFAFYLPYLILLELWLRFRRRSGNTAGQAQKAPPAG